MALALAAIAVAALAGDGDGADRRCRRRCGQRLRLLRQGQVAELELHRRTQGGAEAEGPRRPRAGHFRRGTVSWKVDPEDLHFKGKLPFKIFAEVKPITQATAGPIYRCGSRQLEDDHDQRRLTWPAPGRAANARSRRAGRSRYALETMSDQPPILNEVDTYGPAYMRVADRLGRYDGNEEEAPLAIDLLGLSAGDRVLDAGCGLGRFVAALAEHGIDAVGVDISEIAIAAAKREYPGPTYYVADLMQPLPPELRGFDGLVSLSSSFGFGATVAEDEAMLRAYHEALRPGGRMAMELSDLERSRFRLKTDEGVVERETNGVARNARRRLLHRDAARSLRLWRRRRRLAHPYVRGRRPGTDGGAKPASARSSATATSPPDRSAPRTASSSSPRHERTRCGGRRRRLLDRGAAGSPICRSRAAGGPCAEQSAAARVLRASLPGRGLRRERRP